jgi:hypothetical protein
MLQAMKIHSSDMEPRIKTTHIFLGRSLFFRGEKSNLFYVRSNELLWYCTKTFADKIVWLGVVARRQL